MIELDYWQSIFNVLRDIFVVGTAVFMTIWVITASHYFIDDYPFYKELGRVSFFSCGIMVVFSLLAIFLPYTYSYQVVPYWVNVLDTLKHLGFFSSFVFGLALCVASFSYILEPDKGNKKYLCISVIAFVISLLSAVFIPSKDIL